MSTVPLNGYFTVSNHSTKSTRLSSNAYIYLELFSSARMSYDKWQILTFKPYLVYILDETKRAQMVSNEVMHIFLGKRSIKFHLNNLKTTFS